MLATGTVVGVAVQQSVSADVSSGDRPVLIQITPCRLADTRPAPNTVGPKSSPLAAAGTMTVSAQQAGTDCTGKIPAGATALSLNVTALNATGDSFVTVWPGGERPIASALNPTAGQRVFNAVTAELAADQTFQVYNNRGSVDVFIDVNGYYENHNHDDLYGGSGEPSTAGTFSVGTAGFDSWSTNIGWQKSLENGVASGGAWVTDMPYSIGTSPTVGLAAPVQLPDGATVDSVVAYFEDTTLTSSLAFQLRCEELDGGVKIVANGSSTADPTSGEATLSITTSNATVDNSVCSYFFIAESGGWASEMDQLKIRGASITTS